jgi:hypothetical protein
MGGPAPSTDNSHEPRYQDHLEFEASGASFPQELSQPPPREDPVDPLPPYAAPSNVPYQSPSIYRLSRSPIPSNNHPSYQPSTFDTPAFTVTPPEGYSLSRSQTGLVHTMTSIHGARQEVPQMHAMLGPDMRYLLRARNPTAGLTTYSAGYLPPPLLNNYSAHSYPHQSPSPIPGNYWRQDYPKAAPMAAGYYQDQPLYRSMFDSSQIICPPEAPPQAPGADKADAAQQMRRILHRPRHQNKTRLRRANLPSSYGTEVLEGLAISNAPVDLSLLAHSASSTYVSDPIDRSSSRQSYASSHDYRDVSVGYISTGRAGG